MELIVFDVEMAHSLLSRSCSAPFGRRDLMPKRVLEQTVHQRRCAYWCPAAQHNR